MTSSVYCQENFQVTFIALFIGHNYNNIISLYRIHNLNSTIYSYINHAIVVTKKKVKLNKNQILHAFSNCPTIK